MGTLTKKLHILKSGGTEETCNIYTTPEEVGGSPYLALEVDGQKGYVKLGSTTDANATHLMVKKNDTTYAAWKQATVDVPSGSTTIRVFGYNSASFTVPNGVRVVNVYGRYVGVTPNKTYALGGWIPSVHHSGEEGEPFLQSSSDVYWYGCEPEDYPDKLPASFTITWGGTVNAYEPDVTDY